MLTLAFGGFTVQLNYVLEEIGTIKGQLLNRVEYKNQGMKLIRMDGMKIYKFLLFTATIIPLLQGGESAVVQFPCDHRLRLSFPDLFLHCNTAECFYSDWTNWEMVPNSVVSSASCASREAFREKRTRSALGCEDETETKLICKCLCKLDSANKIYYVTQSHYYYDYCI